MNLWIKEYATKIYPQVHTVSEILGVEILGMWNSVCVILGSKNGFYDTRYKK